MIGVVASYLAAVVVPVAVALLLAALLSPAVHLLQTRGVPRGVATALVMLTSRPDVVLHRFGHWTSDHRRATIEQRLRRSGPLATSSAEA